MIVVDSSVWIDYFNGVGTHQSDVLHDLLGSQLVVVGDLVLAEVLQGFRTDSDFERACAALLSGTVVCMVGPQLAVASALNYRKLRAMGLTVRKTIDVLIATYCIQADLPLLYSDRDFDPCVEHLGLLRLG